MPEAVLEFKARDGAWYAGTAVFEGPFLRIHFEHFPEEEDERWLPQKFKSPQDVKKMIRPASQPMQDSQCSGLRRGAFLCVACRRSNSECFEYYDAKLQQFHRSPHTYLPDGQECCMCEFEVEWLGGPLLHKRQFVSCGDICLRTPGDIEDDPVIKDYIGEVKSEKVCKSLGSKDISENNTILTPKKKKAPSSVDQKMQQVSLDGHEQSVLESGQKGINTSLQCGESSNQMGDCGMNNAEHTEEPPLKKTRLNTQSTSEPAISSMLPDLNELAKKPVDVIQIDSDKEEDSKPLLFRAKDSETDAAKDALPAKITESLDHSKLNDGKKLHVPLVDEFSAHDFSGLSKEQMFSCVGNLAACSCIASQRHCFKSESCPYEAVGFIPLAPCHLTSMCGHRKCKPSCKWKRNSGHMCALSATSQVCSKFAHSQAGNTVHSQGCEEGESGDNKENIKADQESKRRTFCEGVKGLSYSQFLLVENIEKDIMPFKALKAARKVSSGASTVCMWPSLEYETTRKGYICYQDSEAAKAAYLNFSAGKFIITSSKGRPWVVSQVHRHKLDWIQLYNTSTAAMPKEEDMEAVKEEVEDGDLLILYKGTEEYTMAVGKQKLFRVQQEKLRLCYQKFIDEEKELETLT
eukprot:c1519_g1_i1 orf=752-2653(+)